MFSKNNEGMKQREIKSFQKIQKATLRANLLRAL